MPSFPRFPVRVSIWTGLVLPDGGLTAYRLWQHPEILSHIDLWNVKLKGIRPPSEKGVTHGGRIMRKKIHTGGTWT